MRAGEARRRLRNVGWKPIHVTADNHDIWESPNGDRRMMALGHARGEIHRNAAAFVLQVERVAAYAARPDRLKPTLQENLMATTAVLEPTPAPNGSHIEPEPTEEPKPDPKILVYRGRGVTSSAIFYLGQAEAAELGGVGTRISVLYEDIGWVLRANLGGLGTLRSAGVTEFQVSSRAISKVITPTARTEIPAERCKNGFILFPDLITLVPFTSDGPLQPTPSIKPPVRTHASLWDETRRQYADRRAQVEATRAREEAAFITQLDTALAPLRKAPLEELRAALEHVRKLAAELGAELRIDDRGMLRAKLTLEI